MNSLSLSSKDHNRRCCNRHIAAEKTFFNNAMDIGLDCVRDGMQAPAFARQVIRNAKPVRAGIAGVAREFGAMKIRVACALALLCATPLAAHDFWIQPTRFQVEAGAPLGLTFLVGHGKAKDRWANNNRIVMAADFFADRRTDLRPFLRSGGSDLVARFRSPGLHIVALESNHAMSELPAGRFNDYLKEEGLALAIATRDGLGKTGTAGRERYSRRAKAMIQVGRQTATNQAIATRPIGLTLEIVPDRNPYLLDRTRMLPLHVLYKGRRLANATVKLTNLAADEKPTAIAVTDAQGRARFRVPATGEWQVNVVWAEPVAGDPKVDFETVFSSLTFGFAKRRHAG